MRSVFLSVVLLVSAVVFSSTGWAWTPLAADLDPLVRMPGTQPDVTGSIPFIPPGDGNHPSGESCVGCHKGDPVAATDKGMPSFFWQGSMMAQAARDPIFWATMTVAGQDSVWVAGRPNAMDLCLRCHFPEGWLNGRSTVNSGLADGTNGLNGSAMTGSDFDGVHCDVCHRMYDPFFKATSAGTRGESGSSYWDEDPLSVNIPISLSATEAADWNQAAVLKYFNGTSFFNNGTQLPAAAGYTENGGGQMFVDTSQVQPKQKRGPFADALVDVSGHTALYSRYHKSKYFCSTCHDVSNSVLANIADDPANPLTSETTSASSYAHVERTFSEFMSSAYGQVGGAATNQEFQDQGGAGITQAAKCQDCHMPDVNGVTSASGGGVVRPGGSTDHPNSGVPMHDLQGGNSWITHILASLDNSLAIYDTTNAALLGQGPAALTLDLSQGIDPRADSNGEAIEAASLRAKDQLLRAVTVKDTSYDPATGALSFKVQNNTGHKLLSGYPEGRRMFVNIKAYQSGVLFKEVNPYDSNAGTLKGLTFAYNGIRSDVLNGAEGTLVDVLDPVALTENESHDDSLIYEAKMASSLTGEVGPTFHFALGDSRYKDNRIPPKGFDLATAISRLCQPVTTGGAEDTVGGGSNLYSAAELAGGYDDVALNVGAGMDRVEVTVYYQGTSREYIEFLANEINGTSNTTLPGGAATYVVQTDPFFAKLKAWGDTMWYLWAHNHGLARVYNPTTDPAPAVDGIVPFQMAQAAVNVTTLTSPNGGQSLIGTASENITWSAPIEAEEFKLHYTADGGSTWSLISSGTGNVRTFTWAVPNVLSQKVRVRVSAYDGLGNLLSRDRSDTLLSISPAVSISAPTVAETVMGGSTYSLAWRAVAPTADHYLARYSVDGGASWVRIAGYIPGGTWEWPVPQVATSQAMIKVTAFDQGHTALGYERLGPFTIQVPVDITAPTDAGTLTGGSPTTITWASNSLDADHFLVKYSLDGGANWVKIAGGVTLTSQTWSVPATATSQARVKVTAFDVDNNILGYDRTEVFTIQ